MPDRCWKTQSLYQCCVYVYEGMSGRIFAMLKSSAAATENKLAADLSFSKGCRTGEVETCLYTCNHTSARTVGKMLIAPLKSGSCDHKKGVFALFRLMVSHGVLVG